MKLVRTFLAFVVFLGACATLSGVDPEEWEGFQIFTNHHVEINVRFDSAEGRLVLNVFNDDNLTFYQPGESVFWIKDNHLFTLPTPVPDGLSTLGEPGDEIYLLPSSLASGDQERILHGMSGYGLGNNDLVEGTAPMILADVSGPGDVLLWLNSDEVYWDTGRPEGEFGFFENTPGGHHHRTWGFNRRGIHILTLETEGTVKATGQPAVTEATSFLYMIDPRSHEWWQLRHFGFEALKPHAALDHPSPANGLPNLISYAFDLDPHASSLAGMPRPEIRLSDDGKRRLALRHRRPQGDPEKETRSDLIYQLEGSENLHNWTPLEEGDENDYRLISNGEDDDGTPLLLAVLNETIEDSPYRFLRFRIVLNSQ